MKTTKMIIAITPTVIPITCAAGIPGSSSLPGLGFFPGVVVVVAKIDVVAEGAAVVVTGATAVVVVIFIVDVVVPPPPPPPPGAVVGVEAAVDVQVPSCPVTLQSSLASLQASLQQ